MIMLKEKEIEVYSKKAKAPTCMVLLRLERRSQENKKQTKQTNRREKEEEDRGEKNK